MIGSAEIKNMKSRNQKRNHMLICKNYKQKEESAHTIIKIFVYLVPMNMLYTHYNIHYSLFTIHAHVRCKTTNTYEIGDPMDSSAEDKRACIHVKYV